MLTRPYVDKEDILLLDSDILFDPQIVAKLLGYGQADALALNHHTLGEEEIKVIATMMARCWKSVRRAPYPELLASLLASRRCLPLIQKRFSGNWRL